MKSIDPAQREMLRLVGTMLRFVRAINEGFHRASGADLSLTDLSVLVQIERGTDQPSAIARALRLDRPRVTRITDHLVALGTIEREVDRDDRRRCHLRLTEEGRECVARSLLAVSSTVDSILEAVPAEDRAALLRSLDTLRPILDALPDASGSGTAAAAQLSASAP